MDKNCPICLGIFHRETHHRADRARTCQHKLATPGPDCWFERGGLHKLVAESLLKRRPVAEGKAERREQLLRDLQTAASVNDEVAKQYLSRITPTDRWWLLQFVVPELRDWILSVFKDNDLAVIPELEPVNYPELPEALLTKLKEWEKKNKSRLTARLNTGHPRSPSALRRLMGEPIALASFLSESGVTRWDAMKISDRIAFAKTRPISVQQKLQPFIDFLDGSNPFKKGRGRRAKKAKKVIKETRQIPIIPPDELKLKLKEARERLSDEAYLLYWLVAKLGLTAKAAHGLTLDRITINQRGKLVIRPAEAWVALPKNLACTMESLAREADPKWPYDDPDTCPEIPVMEAVVSKYLMGKEVFLGETALLRSSAIYAAMHEGQLDRKTLCAITGVSHTTIITMEYMVPADIHSLASHKLIKARNKALLGEEDE